MILIYFALLVPVVALLVGAGAAIGYTVCDRRSIDYKRRWQEANALLDANVHKALVAPAIVEQVDIKLEGKDEWVVKDGLLIPPSIQKGDPIGTKVQSSQVRFTASLAQRRRREVARMKSGLRPLDSFRFIADEGYSRAELSKVKTEMIELWLSHGWEYRPEDGGSFVRFK